MRFAADRSSVRSSSNPVFLIRNRAAGALPPESWNSSGETRWAASRGRQPAWAISHSAWTAPLGLLSQADPLFLLPIPRGSDRPPVARSGARQIGGFSAAEDRSPPTWGKPEAARSGGVLLAPLPEQRKCGLDTRGAKFIRALSPEITSPPTRPISPRIPGP